MEPVQYGRKIYSIDNGNSSLISISVTEKPFVGEDEKAFRDRLLYKYKGFEGTLEIVIKNGRPSHATIITPQTVTKKHSNTSSG